MWILIMFAAYGGMADGRAVSINNASFVKESSCQEAGQAFVKMAGRYYDPKFICVRAN